MLSVSGGCPREGFGPWDTAVRIWAPEAVCPRWGSLPQQVESSVRQLPNRVQLSLVRPRGFFILFV